MRWKTAGLESKMETGKIEMDYAHNHNFGRRSPDALKESEEFLEKRHIGPE